MYIRRDRLDDVGYFDEATFGKGYGEENDWCQRAEKRGWTNYHQLNVFAYHKGGVSFAEEGEPPKHAISVMGDASVPYALLKKVLYTCAQAGFRDVSQAVEYQSRASEDSVSLPGTTTSGASA